MTRKGLIDYARAGNNEMVTRRVNGGLNGYQDRLHWYDKVALELLGVSDVRTFQKSAGLVVDGISGPKTRAAMHEALVVIKANTPAPAPNTPAQREVVPPVSAPSKGPGAASGALLGGLLVTGGYIAAQWHDFTAWVASFFN